MNTNRPITWCICRFDERSRQGGFLPGVAPVKKEKKIYCNIKKERAGESKKLKENNLKRGKIDGAAKQYL